MNRSPELLFVAFIVGSLVLLKLVALLKWLRARRHKRELENEFLLRVAMDDAQRYGLLPDDVQ